MGFRVRAIEITLTIIVILLIMATLFVTKAASADDTLDLQCSDWAEQHTYDKSERYAEYYSNVEHLIPEIRSILIDHDLSTKWIWLMLVESGGKIDNESDAGARGLWQLTKSTARHYGCHNRKDPIENTKAAAKYISKLMRDFDGDIWSVVVGYNMGGSNFKSCGKPTDEAKALADIVTCLMVVR